MNEPWRDDLWRKLLSPFRFWPFSSDVDRHDPFEDEYWWRRYFVWDIRGRVWLFVIFLLLGAFMAIATFIERAL